MAAAAAGGGKKANRPQGGRGKRGKRRRRNADSSGAVLGVRLLRYSGVQGVSLLTTNLAHFASLIVVANFLGPAELGRYSLLLFLAALITMVFHLASKPGTIRRTFGMDDEDDDDDADSGRDETAASPQRTLGIGLIWSGALGALATALVIVFREPIADFLLGDGGAENQKLVIWAGVLGGLGVVFKLASITLWLERRPGRFLVSDTSRTAFNLAGITAFLVAGWGVDGAIIGAAVGTTAATLLTLVLLRGSYDLAFDWREVAQIVRAGGYRASIVTSFWVVQQADVFILSRFLDHTDVGIYRLGSQLGFVVSFLPQGFRMAMRPLRRGAVFQAVREQYGQKVARGQLLAYFVLLCITSVLLMVLGGELLVQVAPPSYARAAPLIPLTAAAMVMPALVRTVNGTTSYPTKRRRTFQGLVVLGALAYVAICLLLVPEVGIYGPPLAMLLAFGAGAAYLFVRCQRSSDRIKFPYGAVARALVVAAVIAVGFKLLPEFDVWLELLVIAALMGVYIASLFILRVIPRRHWPALAHMAGSVLSGRPDRYNPRAGLRALEPAERDDLRQAVTERVPVGELAGGDRPAAGAGAADGAARGDELVGLLRRVGEHGGMPVGSPSSHDALIAKFLFADAPTAVRNATMRRLLSEGAESGDLRALEDLVGLLAKAPSDAWEGRRASESGGRRRKAMARRGRRAAARAVRGIGRRI